MRILFNLHVPKMRIFSLEPVLLIRNLDPVGSEQRNSNLDPVGSEYIEFRIWIRLDRSSEIRIWIRSDQSISNSESGSGRIRLSDSESGSGSFEQNLDWVLYSYIPRYLTRTYTTLPVYFFNHNNVYCTHRNGACNSTHAVVSP